MGSRDWVPISGDRDPVSRRARARVVAADVALHGSGAACPGCGESAWLGGGDGCRCARVDRAGYLTRRCLAAAEALRGA